MSCDDHLTPTLHRDFTRLVGSRSLQTAGSEPQPSADWPRSAGDYCACPRLELQIKSLSVPFMDHGGNVLESLNGSVLPASALETYPSSFSSIRSRSSGRRRRPPARLEGEDLVQRLAAYLVTHSEFHADVWTQLDRHGGDGRTIV